jgi:hypothetical protein
MPRSSVNFDTVRKIGLALPGVEESNPYGSPALKVHGKLLACVPAHRSAEPGSLVVRVGFDDRAELLAARASQASDVGSIPIARSITHDDSIVLTPLTPLKRPIKPGVLVPSWSQRNKLVPTSQPEVGRRWPPVLAIGR